MGFFCLHIPTIPFYYGYAVFVFETINTELYNRACIMYTVNVLKIQPCFFFCDVLIRTKIHKMLVRLANREYLDQTASSEAV